MSDSQILVGQQLAEARLNQGLSREDVISILRIRESILDTIESDDYPEQVIDVFMKGHIETYCRLLKKNPQTILNQLESKGYDFPKPLAREVKEARRFQFNFRYLLPLVFFALLMLFSPSSNEPKRNITKPYHGYHPTTNKEVL